METQLQAEVIRDYADIFEWVEGNRHGPAECPRCWSTMYDRPGESNQWGPLYACHHCGMQVRVVDSR